MFSYVAAVWNPKSHEQRRVAASIDRLMRRDSHDWRPVFKVPGMTVFCAGIRAGSTELYPLHDESGVVLGTVFSADNIVRKAVFGSAETGRILRTRGRSLAEDFWVERSGLLPAWDALATHVSSMTARMGLPTRLSEVGVPESGIPALVEGAMGDGTTLLNPREPSESDYEQLYKRAL